MPRWELPKLLHKTVSKPTKPMLLHAPQNHPLIPPKVLELTMTSNPKWSRVKKSHMEAPNAHQMRSYMLKVNMHGWETAVRLKIVPGLKILWSTVRIMADWSKRLQRLQAASPAPELETLEHLTLAELRGEKITFGKTHAGKTFEDVWLTYWPIGSNGSCSTSPRVARWSTVA